MTAREDLIEHALALVADMSVGGAKCPDGGALHHREFLRTLTQIRTAAAHTPRAARPSYGDPKVSGADDFDVGDTDDTRDADTHDADDFDVMDDVDDVDDVDDIDGIDGVFGADADDAAEFVEDCLAAEDLEDVVYAVAALADEIALSAPPPIASYWLPRMLQTHLFGENNAGHGFYARLRALLSRSGSPITARVFDACLSLGFRGRYASDADAHEIKTLRGSLRERLLSDGKTGEVSMFVTSDKRATPSSEATQQRPSPWRGRLLAIGVITLVPLCAWLVGRWILETQIVGLAQWAAVFPSIVRYAP